MEYARGSEAITQTSPTSIKNALGYERNMLTEGDYSLNRLTYVTLTSHHQIQIQNDTWTLKQHDTIG